MEYLRWLFCPHDWERIQEIEVYVDGGRFPAYRKLVLQCSKCKRFKKMKV